MKEIFPGYYKKNEEDIRQIWEHGIIMFDTNVLLNLYRYSDSTQNTILDVIRKFSKQIYLPHQAALEYNRNRYEVIAEQEKAYNEFLDKITQIQKDLQSTSKPPFLTVKVDKELNTIFEKVGGEVKESMQKYSDFLKYDPIYTFVSELFSNRITEPFNEDELKEIYKEGEERFKYKVPPGFEDEKNKEGNTKFGDLVLWKQIIKKAKELQKDVLLITDERKIDWWWKLKDGRIMGPRQELVEEIKLSANVDFYMYSSERFLSYGQSFLKEKINQQALQEIEAMKQAEVEELLRTESLNQRFLGRELKLKDEIEYATKRIDEINEEISYIRKRRESILHNNIDVEKYKNLLHELSSDEEKLKNDIHHLISNVKSNYKILNEPLNESDATEMKLRNLINALRKRNS